MFLTRLLPFLLLPLALAQTTPKAKCAKGVHIIHFRGNGGTSGPQQGYGITLPLIDAIKAAVPGSTNISVPYPKGGSANTANLKGVKGAMHDIATYTKSCPKTPIVLTGYSEGASIQMNVVCGTDFSSPLITKTAPLSAKYKDIVIAVVVYADGTRVAGEPYNRGTCKKSGPVPRSNPAGCDTYAPVIRSYCHNKDEICCEGGNSKQAHHDYFTQYDTTVGKYVAAQFKKFEAAS